MRMRERSAHILCPVVLTIGFIPCHAWAQSAAYNDGHEQTSVSGPKKVLDDVKNYVTGPLHWDQIDWLYFGGALVAIGAAHQFDGTVRTHFTAGSKTALNGKDKYSTQDALPAAAIVAGTGLYAFLIVDPDGRTETWSMLEAAGLSSATAYALKFAAGRQRPSQTTDPNRWRKNGDSFPSLHITAAFAIGTVLAESGNDEFRWIRRFLGYGIAAGSVYQRLKHNQHWLSDTIAGAALGMASAHFVINHERGAERSGAFALVPLDGGAMLTYSVPLH